MFSENDLKGLDRRYFHIIMANEYDVTLMSKNTGHYWYLHNPGYPEGGMLLSVIIPEHFPGYLTIL